MNLERFLCKALYYKSIGWPEHNEVFLRFTLLRTPWFRIYIHKVNCPKIPPECHDHPWHFWTCILKNGYWEKSSDGIKFRKPGTILYRPAEFSHSVWTEGDAWSIILTSEKVRDWNKDAKCPV